MQPHGNRSRVTEAEFLALPASMDKVELVDGEVVVSPSPILYHQKVVGNLYAALRAWAASRSEPIDVIVSPSDVRLRAGRIVQPDVYLLFERLPASHEGPVDVIPALCAEVISGTTFYDRVTKRYLYAEAGVREYWAIDPAHRLVERWSGPDYAQHEEIDTGALETTLLPGFRLTLNALFEA
jgi:Uma2 family endonuclease